MPASNRRARRQVPKSVHDGPQRPGLAVAGPPSRLLSAHRLQRLPCGRPAGIRPYSLRQNESEEPAPRIRSQATIGWRKCRNCRKEHSFRRLKSPALEPVHHGRRAEPRQLRHPATVPQRLRRDTAATSSLIRRCRAGTRSTIALQSHRTVEAPHTAAAAAANAPEFSTSLSIVQVQNEANACSVPYCTAATALAFLPGAEWSVGCALLSS